MRNIEPMNVIQLVPLSGNRTIIRLGKLSKDSRRIYLSNVTVKAILGEFLTIPTGYRVNPQLDGSSLVNLKFEPLV